MLKKLISYQKILLNSSPPISTTSPNIFNILLYLFAIITIVYMQIFLFVGNTMSSTTLLPMISPIISVWMVNRMIHGDQRLFETIPVSRKYSLLNIFLLSIVSIFILYILVIFSGIVLLGIVIGIAYLANPQSINTSPPGYAVLQTIDTPKGDILMLFILVIILFVGVAITLIKDKKLRLSVFAGFAVIGYGLLFLLKLNMPISPSSGKVEFLESFSIMPQGTTILVCVAISTVIISIASVFMGYKLYVGKSISKNFLAK
jgi:hypothetical protein